MKIYIMPNGNKYRFADGKAPKDAVCIDDLKKKARKTSNKSRKASNKAQETENKAIEE